MEIKRLQRKFIMIATAAIIAVMIIVLGFLNIQNYNSVYRQMFTLLRYIAANEGEFRVPRGDPEDLSITEESKYTLRYFSAVINPDRSVERINVSHVAAVDEEEAKGLAKRVVMFGRKQGRLSMKGLFYVYVVEDYKNDGQKIAVFMDCTRETEGAKLVIQYSMLVGFTCLLIFVFIVSILSKRAMKPVVRNIENQKAFITNAGHELKTPLAIISANTEVIEMTNGENEWTRSTRNQITRLTVLVNNLIMLSKSGETNSDIMSDVNFSEIANDVVSSFSTLILQQEKTLKSEIEDGIIVKATKDGLSELMNILLDNAAKYCDEKGGIDVELKRRNKHKGVRLTVSNDYAKGESVDYTRFFERFYREDQSHNSKKKGYGIGLSMAKGFAETFGGKIDVSYKDGRISFNVLL